MAALMQPQLVSAQSRRLSYDRYDVDMVVNSDSSVEVTETMDVVLNGTYRGLQRGITLSDTAKSTRCRNSNLNCGGFDNIQLLEVRGIDGKVLNPSQYTSGIEEDEDSGKEYFVVRYQIWPGEGQFVSNQKVSWSIKYKLYGSLGFLNARSALLYWNVLPEDRGGAITNSQISVTLPKGHIALNSKFNSYGLGATSIFSGNSFTINLRNIPNSSTALTIEYLIDDGSVIQPAKLKLNMLFPWLPANQFKLDGVEFTNLKSLPAGKHKLEIGYAGYESQTFDLDIVAGSIVELDIRLTPTPIMWILLALNAFLYLFGIFAAFWLPYRVYRNWRNKGRDQGKIPTIIPLYTPPAGIKPYLAGSIRDEKVDPRDIIGTIIDLAYRGFIKIKETSKKKYTLIKDTRFKSEDRLDLIEGKLMANIFGSSDEVSLEDIGATFHTKYIQLRNDIYQKLAGDGYFDQSPEKTRIKYYGFGGGFLSLGIALIVFSVTLFLLLMGVPGPITLGSALVLGGIAWLIAAPHMPAKTVLGSKAFNEIEGFKMYMFHAERYRLQNLTPDEFERYLGYAIAFDIERQWSDSFKDIFKQQPEWFEGNGISVWDVYWANRFVSNFSSNLNSTVFTPAATGSGSGWSGGGGFGGGFSGGGGGGGFSGGF